MTSSHLPVIGRASGGKAKSMFCNKHGNSVVDLGLALSKLPCQILGHVPIARTAVCFHGDAGISSTVQLSDYVI